jgi:DNA/RNA endonuclease YhcR with UshA esterase domain
MTVLFTVSVGAQKPTISARDASLYIGQKATVCGEVVSTYYARSSRGRPTFLNIDRPYPNHIFTVVIFGDNRGSFGAPESRYSDRYICVTGKIKSYKGKAQIIAYSPKQIKAR